LLDAEALGMSSQEVTEKLFKKAKIATTPMGGWGENAAKYVRFVFSNESKERLIGVGKKLKKALDLS
jgi:aspartate/methionine/tyrosine aminotransferase